MRSVFRSLLGLKGLKKDVVNLSLPWDKLKDLWCVGNSNENDASGVQLIWLVDLVNT